MGLSIIFREIPCTWPARFRQSFFCPGRGVTLLMQQLAMKTYEPLNMTIVTNDIRALAATVIIPRRLVIEPSFSLTKDNCCFPEVRCDRHL